MKTAEEILQNEIDKIQLGTGKLETLPLLSDLGRMVVSNAMKNYLASYKEQDAVEGEAEFSYQDMMDIAGWMAAADCKRPISELKEEAEVYIKTKRACRPNIKSNEVGEQSVEKLKQIFDNNADCYADTKGQEGELTPLIPAMTKDKFIEVFGKTLPPKAQYSKPNECAGCGRPVNNCVCP